MSEGGPDPTDARRYPWWLRWRSQPFVPQVPVVPPAPVAKPRRLAADALLRVGEDPAESLRSVRRAQVGRWWIQVRPWSPGFRAEAHTITGLAAVWAGELRSTLAEATDDAIAMIEVLREE